MQAALREMNDVIEEGGWDQPSSLWAVTRDINQDGFILMFEQILGGDIFTGEHPTDTLAAVADAAERVRPPVGDNLFAFAFVSEAWMVMREDIAGTVEPRRFHEHPARLEVRTIGAVDIAGFRYLHTFTRGSGVRHVASHRRNEKAEMMAEGFVIESLERLVEATL